MRRCWACRLRGLLGASPEGCPRCRRIAEGEAALEALLRAPAEPEEDLWPGLEARIAGRPGPGLRTTPVPVAWWTAAAAAVFVIAVLGSLLTVRGPHGPASSTAPPAAATAAPRESSGPDLVVLSAQLAGKPATFTVVPLGGGQTVVFLQRQ